jgi:amino acid transporter
VIQNATLSFIGIRFRAGLKAQGFTRHHLPFSSRFTVQWCWYAFIASLVIMITQGWNVFVKGGWDIQEFLSDYFGIVLCLFCFTFWKIKKKTKFVRVMDMDFVSRVEEFDKLEEYYKEQ